jgi:hypothetical protein
MSNKTEARRNLEVRAAFIYFVTLIFISAISALFQFLGNVDLAGIIKPVGAFSFVALLAYKIYAVKKRRGNPKLYMWVVATLTIFIPVYAKFNYAGNAGYTSDAWTFALESYNSSILIVGMIMLQQLLFNKTIIITSSIIGFC